MKCGGYIRIKAPKNYPGNLISGRYANEHQIVWWKHTGEIVKPPYEIHHKNFDQSDNRFKNLQKLTKKKHRQIHNDQGTAKMICCVCKNIFERKISRIRGDINGGRHLVCSISCGASIAKIKPIKKYIFFDKLKEREL